MCVVSYFILTAAKFTLWDQDLLLVALIKFYSRSIKDSIISSDLLIHKLPNLLKQLFRNVTQVDGSSNDNNRSFAKLCTSWYCLPFYLKEIV